MKPVLHLAAYGPHGRTVSACARRSHCEFHVTRDVEKVTCKRCRRTELFERLCYPRFPV